MLHIMSRQCIDIFYHMWFYYAAYHVTMSLCGFLLKVAPRNANDLDVKRAHMAPKLGSHDNSSVAPGEPQHGAHGPPELI